MRAVNSRRVGTMVVVVSAMVAGGACAPLSHTTNAPPEMGPLEVNNRSHFDVVVYALPAPGSVGYRLGNAPAVADTPNKIPPTAARGRVLLARLHATGSPARRT